MKYVVQQFAGETKGCLLLNLAKPHKVEVATGLRVVSSYVALTLYIEDVHV